MKKNIFVFILSLFMISFTFSEEKQTEVKKINIEEAINLATENNISLKRNKLSLDLLEKKNATSWNNLSPTISISGNYGNSLENDSYRYSVSDYKSFSASSSTNTGSFFPGDNANFSFSGSLSLNLSPSIYTTIRGAYLNYEDGKFTYEQAIKTVELNLRKAFYSILYQKENISLQTRNLQTAKQQYNLSLDKYNKGNLSELDLLTAQVNYENLKPTLDSSIISYENNLASFKQILGIDQDVEIELEGSLEDALPSSPITIESTLDNLPSIISLENKIDSAKNSLLATRFSAWGPSITTSFSYGLSSSGSSSANYSSLSQSWGISNSSSWGSTSSLSIGLKIPLDGFLPWSSGAMSIESQKTTVKDLQLQLEDEKTNASIEIQNSLNKIAQAQLQLDSLQKNVELSEKTYNMTLTAYNHGSKDLLTLQNASDSLMKAKNSQQSQYYTLISSILDLESTLGIPFGTLGQQTNKLEK